MLGFGRKQNRSKGPSDFPVWILGRDYAQPGDRYIQKVGDRLAGGISAGSKKCVRGKDEGNEDALGALLVDSGRVLLLADSHFGRFAAEHALDRFDASFKSQEGDLEERLFKTVLHLDSLVRSGKQNHASPVAPNCAATLICVCASETAMAWCSIGDSSLWHIRRGQVSLQNEKTQNFLGDYQPLAEPLRRQLDAWGWIDPTLTEPELAEWYWAISNLNRAVRGLDRDRVPVDRATAMLKKMMPQHVRVEEGPLLEPWQPLHLLAQAVLPEWGTRSLAPGDRLFLASDGVDEPVSQTSLEVLLEQVARKETPPEETVATALDLCHGRRGGDDNLCCWVLDA